MCPDSSSPVPKCLGSEVSWVRSVLTPRRTSKGDGHFRLRPYRLPPHPHFIYTNNEQCTLWLKQWSKTSFLYFSGELHVVSDFLNANFCTGHLNPNAISNYFNFFLTTLIIIINKLHLRSPKNVNFIRHGSSTYILLMLRLSNRRPKSNFFGKSNWI